MKAPVEGHTSVATEARSLVPTPPSDVPAPAVASAPAPPAPSGPRIYSKARFAWIQAQPRASNGWIGYLGLGGSVAVRGESLEKAHVAGSGGCKDWYAIEPRGYVCAGDAATVDPEDSVVRTLAADAPHTDSPWPYEYGESTGAPRYRTLPTDAEQRHSEWDLTEHRDQVARARAGEEPASPSLAGIDLTPAGTSAPEWTELSPLVREGRKRIANGSTVAYTRSFDFGGRTFHVAHDHALVPKDRVRPYPRSSFHGVELGGEITLPIAMFRQHERSKYRRTAEGTFVEAGASWPRLSFVTLTGEAEKAGDQTFLATREPGVFVRESDASVVRAASATPAIVGVSSAGGRRTWLDVSVLDGTLVAYEGDRPVFATLISPGRGGVPLKGIDPLETASTPTGTFRVDGKFVTATMVSSTNDLLVHTEVQFVQNFHGPHALHGAYWHDAWGEKKSGGCVNLAPIDAKRVFDWSEPRIPEGWYGMRSIPEVGAATVIIIHK